MEISPPEDEGDPPLLIDSGTESYTESPTAEESDKFGLSPCQSEDSTILCDIGKGFQALSIAFLH